MIVCHRHTLNELIKAVVNHSMPIDQVIRVKSIIRKVIRFAKYDQAKPGKIKHT